MRRGTDGAAYLCVGMWHGHGHGHGHGLGMGMGMGVGMGHGHVRTYGCAGNEGTLLGPYQVPPPRLYSELWRG